MKEKEKKGGEAAPTTFFDIDSDKIEAIDLKANPIE